MNVGWTFDGKLFGSTFFPTSLPEISGGSMCLHDGLSNWVLLASFCLGELRTWLCWSSTRRRRRRTSPTRRRPESEDLKPAFQVALAEQKHARSACTLCTELLSLEQKSSHRMHGTACSCDSATQFWCSAVFLQAWNR